MSSDSEDDIRSSGKLGLALSGGGFRAALFHIGVLARLAELDVLRSVEVLSTVSGGSIVGALYYVNLKHLLESKLDKDIGRDDYVRLLQRMETHFLAGVQSNLRLQTLCNPVKNLRMLWQKAYSRSDRMAELYDIAFYNAAANDLKLIARPSLDKLKIQPLGFGGDFRPNSHNGLRDAKVPILILNATTLNTGRNWQFTAEEMGEWAPPDKMKEIDKNSIFEAFEYKGAALEKYRHVPLSIAVAASACVPAIFHPMPLTNLYRNVTPKLVDGGVQDNQGTAPILFEHCTDIIVSDASGQMADEKSPSSFFGLVGLRAKSILEDRVRDLGLESLVTHEEADVINKPAILHLRDGLDVRVLKPQQALQPLDDAVPQPLLYGIDKRVQRRLSAMRTDLDAFTEVEAYSLMFSGYSMTDYKAREDPIRKYCKDEKDRYDQWQFLAIRDFADCTTENKYYLQQLGIAGKNLFKPFLLLRKSILLPILLVLVLAVCSVWPLASQWMISYQFMFDSVICTQLSGQCVASKVLLVLLALVVLVAIISVLISLSCLFNLKVMTPLFLRLGSLEYLKKRSRVVGEKFF